MAGNEDLIATNEELIEEVIPPEAFSEDTRISILAEISEIAAYSRTNSELFEGCIHKIFSAIPNAERSTILIDFHGELLPKKYIPREQSYHSETYAKKTRDTRKAISWLRNFTKESVPDSMVEVVAAMYAPMIRNGKVIGVLHADSTKQIQGFTKSELDILSVIANVLALSIKQVANDEQKIPSVFISYAHVDSQNANKIKGDLRRNGISVWIDERLKAGDLAWQQQLEIAIREQHNFLFLMTPSCVSSPYCQWELEKAQVLNKRIIPVLLANGTEVPQSIIDKQYINFTNDYSKGITALVDTICNRI
ncbi:MAG: TIR domain-containing protein [Anaerolineales bacterium]